MEYLLCEEAHGRTLERLITLSVTKKAIGDVSPDQFNCPAKSLLFPSIKISTWEVRLWALGSIACIKEKVMLLDLGFLSSAGSQWGL